MSPADHNFPRPLPIPCIPSIGRALQCAPDILAVVVTRFESEETQEASPSYSRPRSEAPVDKEDKSAHTQPGLLKILENILILSRYRRISMPASVLLQIH